VGSLLASVFKDFQPIAAPTRDERKHDADWFVVVAQSMRLRSSAGSRYSLDVDEAVYICRAPLHDNSAAERSRIGMLQLRTHVQLRMQSRIRT
jgi:hypothetical protein